METTDLTIVPIEGERTSQESSGPVVVQKRSRAKRAISSESSPSTPVTAKAAPHSPKSELTEEEKQISKDRKDLAAYIIEKYVIMSKIDWPRDMRITYRLIDKHPEPGFWRQLPVKNLISTMVIMAGPISIKRLFYLYKNYLDRLEIQKKVEIAPPTPQYTIGEKVGEDFQRRKRGARNIIDFCS